MPQRPRSLRFKLAAWFVLVFFLIQTALVGAAVAFRRGMIQRSLDDALAVSAEGMVQNILTDEAPWDEASIESLVPRNSGFVLYAVRDGAGELLVSRGVPDADALPFSAWEVVPAGPVGGVHTVIGPRLAERLTGDAQKLRLITLPFRRGEELYFFQAAVRDEVLERLLGPFLDLVLLGVPAGLVAAMVAAWIIAGRAVAPMQQLSRAAQGVSAATLGERFEVSTSDTEVERLEGELNSALERLEAGYRARDQFISNVSHELRTPVAVLLTQAQVAKMGERSLEKGYAFLDKAERYLKRLGKVVESFLVLARADLAGELPREPVSVIDLIVGSLHSCKEVADDARVRLVPRLSYRTNAEPDGALRGDPSLLQTMVENLVHNAISHSPPDSDVAIEVNGSVESVRIVVRDQGPGIPEEYRERIFDRFVQVPEGCARRDGTGLGLAIAKSVAELHGGRIEVTNDETRGCSFTVTLPMDHPAQTGEGRRQP